MSNGFCRHHKYQSRVVTRRNDTFLAPDAILIFLFGICTWSVAKKRNDLHVRSRMYWDRDCLEFDSIVARGEEEGEHFVRYTLDNSFDTIVTEERFRSKSMNYENVWVLERV